MFLSGEGGSEELFSLSSQKYMFLFLKDIQLGDEDGELVVGGRGGPQLLVGTIRGLWEGWFDAIYRLVHFVVKQSFVNNPRTTPSSCHVPQQ